MSYNGRGSIPSIDFNAEGNNLGNINFRYWRYWYYVPLDNTYVIMQMIATFIILISGFLVYIFSYKSSVPDPIIELKTIYINVYTITIFILLALVFIINFLSKSKISLIKKLIITLIVSLILMITFFIIKINMDSHYNLNVFTELFESQNIDYNPNISRIGLNLAGMKIKTEKEFYIDEYMKLYNIFKIKTYGLVAIHLLLNILFGYQIYKIAKVEENINKLHKNDEIIFDEDKGII